MEHWERFREMTTTQLIYIGKDSYLEGFGEWCEKVYSDAPHCRKLLIFFQEGRTEKYVSAFESVACKIYKEVEIVTDVPDDQIRKMEDLTYEINDQ